MGRIRFFSSVFITLPLLIGCGSGSGGNDPDVNETECASLHLRIAGGSSCDFTTSPVVLVILTDEKARPFALCSGTAVTERDILTAGHCLISAADEPPVRRVFIQTSKATVEAVRFNVHPRYNGALETPFDIGMITVGDGMGVTPVPFLYSKKVEIDDQITVFGYGEDEDGNSAVNQDLKALKAAFMKVTKIDSLIELKRSTGSVCKGDSGGAGILVKDGVEGIIGVNSVGGNTRGGKITCSTNTIAGLASTQRVDILQFIRDYAPAIMVR